ncbi:MAG: hypothetical protein JNL67_00375 [Planctomycetaceae bacterium]|nr:hypothetical protein [Planctomycetaceae bacterium]
MFVDNSVWDWILVGLSAYIAVSALVFMMREYQKKMVIQLKTSLLKRQMSDRGRQLNEGDVE